jgi:protocatechuate 3,4-dioxygenase beta subunit
MSQARLSKLTRRDFLKTSLAVPPAIALAACSGPAPDTPVPEAATAQPATTPVAVQSPTEPVSAPTESVLAPTPACGDDDDVTPQQTEGPFYTPDTPERTSLLEAGISGTKMVLTGYVLSTNCQPIAGALLDFWHADDNGEYDNVGYRLRGHQFADDQGRYTLETVVPGLYPGRTRHIHVKVQAPNQPALTTQLYFPGEPGNDRDGIFNAALVMDVRDVADGKAGAFNFVLSIG